MPDYLHVHQDNRRFRGRCGASLPDTDPKNRQCIQATKLIFDLYGVKNQTREEKRLINAQIDLLEAKAKSVHAVEEMGVEDLSPLAKLLDLRERTADSEENDTN